MTIAFTACRHMMDDPDFYVSCLKESHEELLLAASEALHPAPFVAGTKVETASGSGTTATARVEH